MQVEVVYENHDHFDNHVGPYGHVKVGLKIEDKVVWLSSITYPSSDNSIFNKWENIAKEIAEKCNATIWQHKCEECDTKFAIESPIDEPICPVCSSDNVKEI